MWSGLIISKHAYQFVFIKACKSTHVWQCSAKHLQYNFWSLLVYPLNDHGLYQELIRFLNDICNLMKWTCLVKEILAMYVYFACFCSLLYLDLSSPRIESLRLRVSIVEKKLGLGNLGQDWEYRREDIIREWARSVDAAGSSVESWILDLEGQSPYIGEHRQQKSGTQENWSLVGTKEKNRKKSRSHQEPVCRNWKSYDTTWAADLEHENWSSLAFQCKLCSSQELVRHSLFGQEPGPECGHKSPLIKAGHGCVCLEGEGRWSGRVLAPKKRG